MPLAGTWDLWRLHEGGADAGGAGVVAVVGTGLDADVGAGVEAHAACKRLCEALEVRAGAAR